MFRLYLVIHEVMKITTQKSCCEFKLVCTKNLLIKVQPRYAGKDAGRRQLRSPIYIPLILRKLLRCGSAC